MNENNNTSRRRFLQASGGALGAGWLALHWPQVAAAARTPHAAASGEVSRELTLLTPDQARDVEAVAAQIVPSGATPGAREAGVVYFVDHVHTGVYAAQAPGFVAALTAFQRVASHSRIPRRGSSPTCPSPTQLAYLQEHRADAVLRRHALPDRARPAGLPVLRRQSRQARLEAASASRTATSGSRPSATTTPTTRVRTVPALQRRRQA